MAINYKVIRMAQPGVKGGGEYKYYPRIEGRKKIELKALAKNISEKCTLRRSDVQGVLTALMDEIPQLLKDNYIIKLGDLGTFSVHANVRPSETEEEVGEKNIIKLGVAFRPGTEIKDMLKLADFKKSK